VFRKLELANAAYPGYEDRIAPERGAAVKKLNSGADFEPTIAHDEFLEYARLMLTVRQRFSISADCATTVNAARGRTSCRRIGLPPSNLCSIAF
jgi:hypothetical protein